MQKSTSSSTFHDVIYCHLQDTVQREHVPDVASHPHYLVSKRNCDSLSFVHASLLLLCFTIADTWNADYEQGPSQPVRGDITAEHISHNTHLRIYAFVQQLLELNVFPFYHFVNIITKMAGDDFSMVLFVMVVLYSYSG